MLERYLILLEHYLYFNYLFWISHYDIAMYTKLFTSGLRQSLKSVYCLILLMKDS